MSQSIVTVNVHRWIQLTIYGGRQCLSIDVIIRLLCRGNVIDCVDFICACYIVIYSNEWMNVYGASISRDHTIVIDQALMPDDVRYRYKYPCYLGTVQASCTSGS